MLRPFNWIYPGEVKKIMIAVRNMSNNSERDELFMEVLWETGARVTEALELVPEHVGTTAITFRNLKQVKRIKNPDGKMIRVHDPDALKEVEVSKKLCDDIKAWCDFNKIKKGQWVFAATYGSDKHVNRMYVWRLVTKASERAQVFRLGKNHPRTGAIYRGVGPHTFRHANAMYLLDQTSDMGIVQEQLGHADIRTTQRYAFTERPKIQKKIKEIKW